MDAVVVIDAIGWFLPVVTVREFCGLATCYAGSTVFKRPEAAQSQLITYMESRSLEGYMPPQNRAELERRYAAGERYFPNTDLSGEDLSGIRLDGADFEKHSWFPDANFSGASLRGTSFRECNLKCADFSNCDLTGAILELAAIESIKINGVTVEGVRLQGATCYGYELVQGDELPS